MDNIEIAAFFRARMQVLLTEQGHPEVDVTASFQPTVQGRLDGPVLYFAEVSDEPYGAQSTRTVTDPATQQSTYTSTQLYRITFQVQGLAPANPENLTQLRAPDLVKLTLQLMKSPPFLAALKKKNMGIERIQAIKPNFVVNDRAQFEAGPMFDFTLSYKRTIIQKSAIITSADFAIHRV